MSFSSLLKLSLAHNRECCPPILRQEVSLDLSESPLVVVELATVVVIGLTPSCFLGSDSSGCNLDWLSGSIGFSDRRISLHTFCWAILSTGALGN